MKHEIVFSNSFQTLSEPEKAEASEIVGILTRAMDAYYEGDPFGFAQIYCGNSFTYMDSGTVKKMNSVDEILDLFKKIKGIIISDKYRLEDLSVQFTQDVAVVSFQMFVTAINIDFKWNVTEVFNRNQDGEWRIIHSHYSFIRPMDWKFKEGQFSIV
jgi:ketosteroid isomerase-like protein